jgi:hypothetical protein
MAIASPIYAIHFYPLWGTLFRFLLAVGAAGNGGAFFFSLFSFKNYVL